MISIESIKEHWEIRYKDIDPDTGDISNDKAVSMTLNKQFADSIVNALNLIDDEPNRMYYALKINALSPGEIRDKHLKSKL